MTELTHSLLDSLLVDCAASAKHGLPVPIAPDHLISLIATARIHLPGELLAEVHIPGFLPRVTMNSRGHWSKKSTRIAKERLIVGNALMAGARDLRGGALAVGRVEIIRHSPLLLDSDNCVTSLKGTRDAVAEWLAIDDGNSRITWVAGQEKSKRAGQGVVIRIERRR